MSAGLTAETTGLSEKKEKAFREFFTDQEAKERAADEAGFIERAGQKLRDGYDQVICGILGTLPKKKAELAKDIGKLSNETRANVYLGTLPEALLIKRLEGSESLALWYLLSSGKLKREVDQVAGRNATTKDRVEAAVKVSGAFLEAVDKKNREREFYESPYTPSVGLETEFVLAKQPSHSLSALRSRFGYKYPPLGYSGKYDRLSAFLDKHVGLYALNYSREGSAKNTTGEAQMRPSGSAGTQLRDILHMIKTDVINTQEVFIHLNVGGLKLSEKDQEPMLITSIMAASGFNFFPNINIGTSMGETYKKRAFDKKHYTLHRTKVLQSIYNYKQYLESNLVEFRGNCPFNNFNGLVRSVESSYWLCTAAMAKQRTKDSSENQDATSEKLAEIWDTTQRQWELLLEENDIDLRIAESIESGTRQFNESGSRFGMTYLEAECVINGTESDIDTPYNQALGKIVYLSQNDRDFRQSVRNMIIETRRKVKEALAEGYKEAKKNVDATTKETVATLA